MRIIKYISVVSLFALLSGCSDAAIDATTADSFEKSAQAIYEALPDAQKSDFMQAISMGQMMGIHEEGLSFEKSVDGKTAEEVISYVQQEIKDKTTLRY